MRIHPCRISGTTGLNADYDGDRMNFNGILTENANTEVDKYLNSIESVVLPDGKLAVGFDTYLIKLSMFVMTQGL